MTADSDSASEGSTPSETFLLSMRQLDVYLPIFFSFSYYQYRLTISCILRKFTSICHRFLYLALTNKFLNAHATYIPKFMQPLP
jgi:hypothetical protein